MSNTIRRKNRTLRSMYFNPVWMVNKHIRETKPEAQVLKIADALFHSDSVEGYSAPKNYRRQINRMERFRVKEDLRLALANDALDDFVDSRLHMPYWD